MTLRHLKIFRQVCLEGSVTKAAAVLGMTQPSVSIAISELEQFYETKLFDRISRKLRLTPAGEMLKLYSDSILRQFNESVSQIRGTAVRKSLKVGIVSNFAPTTLPKISRAFQEKHPDVQLVSYVFGSAVVVDLLNRFEVDLIVTGDAVPDNFSAQKLYKDDYVLMCTKQLAQRLKSPVSREDLSEIPLIMPSTPNSLRRPLYDWITGGNSQPRIVMYTDGSHSMNTMSLAGIAALPILRRLALDRIKRNPEMELLEFAEPKPCMEFNLCTLSGKTIDNVMQDYIDILFSAVNPS